MSKRIVALYLAGKSMNDIGREVGLERRAVRTRLVAAGVAIRSYTPKKCKWTEKPDAILRRDYGRKSALQIAIMLSVSKNSVIGRAYRLGLSK